MIPRFVTVFPDGEKVHLAKDVGQIPFIFGRNYGYDATLVVESTDPSFVTDVLSPHLAVEKISPRGRIKGISLAAVLYIARNSRRIDILNLYHFCLQTKLLALLYRIRNPTGFIYVKLDLDIAEERAELLRPAKSGKIFQFFRNMLHERFFNAVDLFSGESKEAVETTKLRFPKVQGKIEHVTNGFDMRNLVDLPDQKENLIITVGRIGTHQKNNELLLEAVQTLTLGDWKIALIGPVNEEFRCIFDHLIETRPDLRGRVTLVGPVNERSELLSWYARAKVFVLTSRYEGFPLVFSEALSFGNFIVTTEVSGVKEITVNQRYGKVVEHSARAIAEALQDFTIKESFNPALAAEIKQYARITYDWNLILNAVNQHIIEHRHA
ncbi:glycosyltransferase [Massilia sp. PWRC2]|uniref:glycosyltransferase n=1 Tax=Massilia sp. PWRC2 TaxID=2804626 RepID=UPI003CF3D944